MTTLKSKIEASIHENTIGTKIRQSILADAVEQAQYNENANAKIQYYLERSCEELNNRLKDISVDSAISFNGSKCKISNITTEPTNESKITLDKVFTIEFSKDIKTEINRLLAEFRSLSIPKKFSPFISTVAKVEEDGTSVLLQITINLPASFVEYLGADDYVKRNNILSKEIKKIADKFLSN